MNFTWKNKTITNVGELFDAVAALESTAEGARFMSEYVAYLASEGIENPVKIANDNIGYIAGYGSLDVFTRIREYTGAVHPVFG